MPRARREDPPYVQVVDYYRTQILGGKLAEGDRLPPVTQLGKEWRISTATAARAIGQLQTEGYVRTRPQGTIAVSPSPDDEPGQAPVEITFVLWDEDTDGVAVKHDGEVVWTESTFGRLDQYLRFTAPRGVPVTIEIEEG